MKTHEQRPTRESSNAHAHEECSVHCLERSTEHPSQEYLHEPTACPAPTASEMFCFSFSLLVLLQCPSSFLLSKRPSGGIFFCLCKAVFFSFLYTNTPIFPCPVPSFSIFFHLTYTGTIPKPVPFLSSCLFLQYNRGFNVFFQTLL